MEQSLRPATGLICGAVVSLVLSCCSVEAAENPEGQPTAPPRTALLWEPIRASSAVEKKMPGLPSQVVRFDATEGTWMNVDVSPNGDMIVFDLLGDLYLLPIAGGDAFPLTTGRSCS